MNDDQQALAQFAGTARLFPLPNVVLFPQVFVPLHVFEMRYRQMTADALASDRLIALALLRPGWEGKYEGKPAIHPIACLGRIVAEESYPDGRYHILLRGLSRLRVGTEVPTETQFRVAQAKLLTDGPLPDLETAMSLRRDLSAKILPRFAANAAIRDQLHELFAGEMTLGPLCDVLSFALPLPAEEKQELLELLDVKVRAERLLAHIELLTPAAGASVDRQFPPSFSSN